MQQGWGKEEMKIVCWQVWLFEVVCLWSFSKKVFIVRTLKKTHNTIKTETFEEKKAAKEVCTISMTEVL